MNLEEMNLEEAYRTNKGIIKQGNTTIRCQFVSKTDKKFVCMNCSMGYGRQLGLAGRD